MLRSVEYWNQTELKVLIFHNTLAPLNVSSFAPNVEYVVSETDFASRSKLASQMIVTKYSILCSDDELLLPSGLFQMGRFLEDHQDIFSAGGQTVALGRLGQNLTATYAYQNMNGYKNLEDSALKRLSHHTINQIDYKTGAMYRLMRASLMREMLIAFSELSNISTPYIFEVTGEVIVNAQGQSTYLEELYWVRNWINDQVVHKGWNRKLYFYQWWVHSDFEQERLKWRIEIQRTIQGTISEQELDNILEDIYVKRKILESREIARTQSLKRLVPSWVKRFKHKVFHKVHSGYELEVFLHKLNSSDPNKGLEMEKAVPYIV